MNVPLKLTNYPMAAGRIGLAILFVPFLLILAYAFFVDTQSNAGIAMFLLLLTVPFVWIAVTVPVFIEIGGQLRIRYPFWNALFSRGEVIDLRFADTYSQFAPETLIPGLAVGMRAHRIAEICLFKRRPIRIKVREEQERRLREWYALGVCSVAEHDA